MPGFVFIVFLSVDEVMFYTSDWYSELATAEVLVEC